MLCISADARRGERGGDAERRPDGGPDGGRPSHGEQ